MSRMNNQWSDEMRKANSDYVIDNQDIDSACAQAVKIIEILLNY